MSGCEENVDGWRTVDASPNLGKLSQMKDNCQPLEEEKREREKEINCRWGGAKHIPRQVGYGEMRTSEGASNDERGEKSKSSIGELSTHEAIREAESSKESAGGEKTTEFAQEEAMNQESTSPIGVLGGGAQASSIVAAEDKRSKKGKKKVRKGAEGKEFKGKEKRKECDKERVAEEENERKEKQGRL